MQNQIELDYYKKSDLILPIQHDIQEIIYDPNDQIISQYRDYIKDSEVDFKLGLTQSGIQKLGWVIQNIQAQKNKSNLNSMFIQAVTLLNNQALQYLNNGEVQNSMLILEKCSTWTSNKDSDPLMRVITLSNIGVCYRKKGKLSKSLDMFNEALQIMYEHNVKSYLSSVYLNLAIIQSQIGAHIKSIEFARKALAESQFELIDVIKPQQKDSQFQNKNENRKTQSSASNTDLIVTQSTHYESKIINLILCYKTLAEEEEHFQNYEEALHNYEKAVDISQQNLGNQNQITLSCIKEFSQFSQRYSRIQVSQPKKQLQIKQKFPSSPFKTRNLTALQGQNLVRPKANTINVNLEKKQLMSPINMTNSISINVNNFSKSTLLDNQTSTKNNSNFFRNSSQITTLTSPSSSKAPAQMSNSNILTPNSVSFYKKFGTSQRPQSLLRKKSQSISKTQASASTDKSELILESLGLSQTLSKKVENKEFDSQLLSSSLQREFESQPVKFHIKEQSIRTRLLSVGNRPNSTKNSAEINRSKILLSHTARNSPNNRSQANIFKTINSPYFTNTQEFKSQSTKNIFSRVQTNAKQYRLHPTNLKSNYSQHHQIDKDDNVLDTLKVQFQDAYLKMKNIEQKIKSHVSLNNKPLNLNLLEKSNLTPNANFSQNSLIKRRLLRPQSMHIGISKSINSTPQRKNQQNLINFEGFQDSQELLFANNTSNPHSVQTTQQSANDIKLLFELKNTFLKDYNKQYHQLQGDLKFYLSQNVMTIWVIFQIIDVQSQYQHTINVSDIQFQKIQPNEQQNMLVNICSQIFDNLFVDQINNYLVYFNQNIQLSDNQSQILMSYKDQNITFIQKNAFSSLIFFQQKINSNKDLIQQDSTRSEKNNFLKVNQNIQKQEQSKNLTNTPKLFTSQEPTIQDDIGEEIYTDDFDLDKSFEELESITEDINKQQQQQNKKQNIQEESKVNHQDQKQIQLQFVDKPATPSLKISQNQQIKQKEGINKQENSQNQVQQKFFKRNSETEPYTSSVFKDFQQNKSQQQQYQNGQINGQQKQNLQPQDKNKIIHQQSKMQLDLRSIYDKVNYVKRIEIQPTVDNTSNAKNIIKQSPRNTTNQINFILSEQLNIMSEEINNRNAAEEGQCQKISQRGSKTPTLLSKKGTLESQFLKVNIPTSLVANHELSPINSQINLKAQNMNQQNQKNVRNSPQFLTQQEQNAGMKIWKAYEKMKFKKVVNWAIHMQQMGRFLVQLFKKKFFEKLVSNWKKQKQAAQVIQDFFKQRKMNEQYGQNQKYTILNIDFNSLSKKKFCIDQDRVIKIQKEFKAYLLRKSNNYQNAQREAAKNAQQKDQSLIKNQIQNYKNGKQPNFFKDLSVIIKIQRLFRRKKQLFKQNQAPQKPQNSSQQVKFQDSQQVKSQNTQYAKPFSVKSQNAQLQQKESKQPDKSQKSQSSNFFKDLGIILKIQRLIRKRLAAKKQKLEQTKQNKTQNRAADQNNKKEKKLKQSDQKNGQSTNFLKNLSVIIKIQRLFRQKQAQKQNKINLQNMQQKSDLNSKNNKNQINSSAVTKNDFQSKNFFKDLAVIIKIQRLFRKRLAEKQKEINNKSQNKQQPSTKISTNKTNKLDLNSKNGQMSNFFKDLSVIIKIQRLFRKRQALKQKQMIQKSLNSNQSAIKSNQINQSGLGDFFKKRFVIIKIQRLFRKRQALKKMQQDQTNVNGKQTKPINITNKINQLSNQNQKEGLADFFKNIGVIIKIQRLFRKKQAAKKMLLKDFFKNLSVIIKIQRLFRKRQAAKKKGLNNQSQNIQPLNKNNNQKITQPKLSKKDDQKIDFLKNLNIIIKIQRLFRKRIARAKKDQSQANFFKNLSVIIKIQRLFRKKQAIKKQQQMQKNSQQTKSLQNKNTSSKVDLGQKESLADFFKNLSLIIKIQRLFRKKQAAKKQKELNQKNQNLSLNSKNFFKDLSIIIKIQRLFRQRLARKYKKNDQALKSKNKIKTVNNQNKSQQINPKGLCQKGDQKPNFFKDLAVIIKIQRLFRKKLANKKKQLDSNKKQIKPQNISSSSNSKSDFLKNLNIIIKIQRLFRKKLAVKQKDEKSQNKNKVNLQNNKQRKNKQNTQQNQNDSQFTGLLKNLSVIIKIQRLFRKRQALRKREKNKQLLNNEQKNPKSKKDTKNKINSSDQSQKKEGQSINFFKNLGVIIKIQRLFRSRLAKKQKEISLRNKNMQKNNTQGCKDKLNQTNQQALNQYSIQLADFFKNLILIVKIQRNFRKRLARKKIELNQKVQTKPQNNESKKNQLNQSDKAQKNGSQINFFKDLAVIIKIQRLFRQRLAKKKLETIQKNKNQDQKQKQIKNKDKAKVIIQSNQNQKNSQSTNFFTDLAIIIKIQRLFRKRQAIKKSQIIFNIQNKDQKSKQLNNKDNAKVIIQSNQVQKNSLSINFFTDLAVIIKIQRLFRKRQAIKKKETISKNQNKDKQSKQQNIKYNIQSINQKNTQSTNFFKDLAVIIKIQRLFRKRLALKKKEVNSKNQISDQQKQINCKNLTKTVNQQNQAQKNNQSTNFFKDLAVIIKIQRLYRQILAQKRIETIQTNKDIDQSKQQNSKPKAIDSQNQGQKNTQSTNFFKDLAVIIKIQRLFRQRLARKKKEVVQKKENNEQQSKQINSKNNTKIVNQSNQSQKNTSTTNFFKDLAIIIKIQRLFRQRLARKKKEAVQKNQIKDQQIIQINSKAKPINQSNQVQKNTQSTNFFKDLAVIIKIQRLFRQRLARKKKEVILKNQNKDQQQKQSNSRDKSINQSNQGQKNTQSTNFFKDLAVVIKIQRLFRKRLARKLVQKKYNNDQQINQVNNSSNNKTVNQSNQGQKNTQSTNFFKDLAVIIKIQRLFRQRLARKKKEATQNQNKDQLQKQKNSKSNIQEINQLNQIQNNTQTTNFFKDLAVIIKIQRLFRQRLARKKKEVILKNQNKNQQLKQSISNQGQKNTQTVNFFKDLAVIIKIQRLFRQRLARKKNQNNLLIKNIGNNKCLGNKAKISQPEQSQKNGQKTNFFKDLAVIIKIQRFFRQKLAIKKLDLGQKAQDKAIAKPQNNQNNTKQLNQTNVDQKNNSKTNFLKDLATIIKTQRLFRKRLARRQKDLGQKTKNQTSSDKTKSNQPESTQSNGQQKINFLKDLAVIIKIQSLFRKRLARKQKEFSQKTQNKIQTKTQINQDMKKQQNSTDLVQKNGQKTNFLKDLTVIIKIQRLFRKRLAKKQEYIKLQKKAENTEHMQNGNKNKDEKSQVQQSKDKISKSTNFRSSDNQKQYTLFVKAPENVSNNQCQIQLQQQQYSLQIIQESSPTNQVHFKQRSQNKNLTVPSQLEALNYASQSEFQKRPLNFDHKNQNNLQQEFNQNQQLNKEKFVNQNSEQNYSIQINFNQNKKNLDNSEQKNNLPSKLQDKLHSYQIGPQQDSLNKHFQNETLQQNQYTQQDHSQTAYFTNNSDKVYQNLQQQLNFNFSPNNSQPNSSNIANNQLSCENQINSSLQKNILPPKNQGNLGQFLNGSIQGHMQQQQKSQDIKFQEHEAQRKDINSNTLPPKAEDRQLKLSNDRMPQIQEQDMAYSKDSITQKNQQQQQDLSFNQKVVNPQQQINQQKQVNAQKEIQRNSSSKQKK